MSHLSTVAMRMIFGVVGALILGLNFVQAQTSTITIGQTTVLSGADNDNGGLLLAQKTSLAQAATINSLSFYVNVPSGTLVLGVYDATGLQWRAGGSASKNG